MNVDLGIWDKLTRVAVFLLFLAGLLLVAVWYLPLIEHNQRQRQRRLALDTLIQKEEDTAKQLRREIWALQHDPKTVERLARERLGYAKPGETVIRFEPAATNSTSSR
jgi:cell division protein FtsB